MRYCLIKYNLLGFFVAIKEYMTSIEILENTDIFKECNEL